MSTPLTLFPPAEQTIVGVGRALREGRTTSVAVLEHCFHQIDLWDERIHAWVYVDRSGAMRHARELDAELAAGIDRGPMHGIPVGIKDIIEVAGMPTAAGFRPWRDRRADTDAAVVGRLRLAGAVILGKTATTQFAWIDPAPTRNPWRLDHTPGGSSSGSAAAVATGMCLAALGSQTGGSITRPASFCGVAGYKPAHGVIPVQGILDFAPSLDHPGPMARSVEDLALVAEALHDGLGAVSHEGKEIPARVVEAFPPYRNRPSIDERPVRLLRPRGFYDRRAHVEALDRFEWALRVLGAAGAQIVERDDDTFGFERILTEHRLVMAAEAAAGHEARFAEHRADYAPHIRALVEEGLATSAPRYIRAHQAWAAAARALPFEGLFHGDEPFDAVITPATIGAAPDISTTGNPCFNSPWSYLGCPVVSFPIVLTSAGLPLALQLASRIHGAARDDMFRVAAWCERAIHAAAKGV